MQKEEGFTLIEVIITMVIFTLVVIVMVSILQIGTIFNEKSKKINQQGTITLNGMISEQITSTSCPTFQIDFTKPDGTIKSINVEGRYVTYTTPSGTLPDMYQYLMPINVTSYP